MVWLVEVGVETSTSILVEIDRFPSSCIASTSHFLTFLFIALSVTMYNKVYVLALVLNTPLCVHNAP